MKTFIKKTISMLLLLIYAYMSAGLAGYAPMENPLLMRKSEVGAGDASQIMSLPSPEVTPAPTEPVEEPEHIPPVLAPKPEYSFPDAFTTRLLTIDWFDECPAPGTIEIREYPATDYLTGKEIVKNMEVYLPNGYTPEIKYDVLIITHGAGDDEKYWFSEEHDYGGVSVNARTLIDNMIYRKACRDLIVVSVTCTNEYSCSRKSYDWDQLLTDGAQFSQEISNNILPFIVENYSTYASDPSKESLIIARDHFAYFGLSWSAMFGYLNILPENMDVFSWYALIAPSRVNLQDKMGIIQEKYATYPIYAVYASVGANDQIRAQSELLYSTLTAGDTFKDGENSYQVIIDNVKHHFESWCTSLYNCLELFF